MARPKDRPRSARARKVTSTAGQAPIETASSSESARGDHRVVHGRRTISSSGLRLRVPIALKFSVMIALLVVVLVGWQTKVTIEASLPQLDAQINQGGLELVTAMATLLRISSERSGDGLARTLEAFQQSQGAGRILNVVVYDKQGGALATARRETDFRITRGETIEFAAARAAGVTIREFDYEGMRVRSFRQATDEGVTGLAGEIEIYISAREIAEARERLTRALVAVSVTAGLAAAAGAFFLARFLTRPIRTLVKDLRAVSHGDLEHQSQVRSSDELGELARTFNLMTRNLRAAEEARTAQKTLEHELAVATQIQTRLLPDEVPDVAGLDISAYYISATEVGGDYYDFIPIRTGHLGIVVADVSGKGIPAALVMTMTRSLLRMASEDEPSPARAARKVNRFLSPDLRPGMFVTMAYLVIDLKSHEVQLARCGHNAPYLYRARSGKLVVLEPGGIAIGLDRSGTLFGDRLKVQRLVLQSGDVLVLYSDGIVEGKNERGEDYGDGRLFEILASNAGATASELTQAVIEDLSRHRGRTAQSDDITILVIKRE